MFLFLVENLDEVNWDMTQSPVICAEDEVKLRKIIEKELDVPHYSVVCLGVAAHDVTSGIICHDFYEKTPS